MRITRVFTEAGRDPFSYFKFVDFSVSNPAEPDKIVKILAPETWSQNAVEILYSKYIRKAGIPVMAVTISEIGVPIWLERTHATAGNTQFCGENSAAQVIHRIVGHWTYAGWKSRYFTAEDDARAFYDDLVYAMCAQMMAPNSPQWFNTGLWWAYGLQGDTINWRWSEFGGENGLTSGARQITREQAYQHPQTSACFIQSIDDSLIGPGGILDTLKAEASIFKYGSGSGINFSSLRAKGQPLSGGGNSSGLMSFLEVFDKNAGSIRSGGTTRRAAKMVVVNADHPEAMDFVTWKAREEAKVRALGEGAIELLARDDEHQEIYGSTCLTVTGRKLLTQIREQISNPWEGVAYSTVSGQNSNNSLRVNDPFMARVIDMMEGRLPAECDGVRDRDLDLFEALCASTWEAGDPGMQFDGACNKWHTIPRAGRQNATNPCSEYSFIDDSSCNLASINLHKFKVGTDGFDAEKFSALCCLLTVVLDITVEMSSYPSAKIAENSAKYRPLGLGYANLGGLLMSMGIPYASHKGRLLAAAITDLMHACAWQTSALMASELGAFSDFDMHHDDVLHVRTLHRNAHFALLDKVADFPDASDATSVIMARADTAWRVSDTPGNRIRNAQLTLLAPTGTIGLLMDCATTGIEPDFALIKHKKRAGGGSMTIINPLVGEGMRALGYTDEYIVVGLKGFEETGDLGAAIDAADVDVFACANDISWQDHLLMMAAVQPFLSGAISKTVNLPNSATVQDIAECYILAWKLGLKAVAPYRDGSKGAQPLTVKKREQGTAETDYTAPMVHTTQGLREAIPAEVAITSVIGMVEALGADVRLTDAADLLRSAKDAVSDFVDGRLVLRRSAAFHFEGDTTATEEVRAEPLKLDVESFLKDAIDDLGARLEATQVGRRKLPNVRRGYTIKAKIEGRTVYLRTGEYNDGRLGEIFLNMDREGSMAGLFLDALAISVSLGLQYGVPLSEFVEAFKHMSGGPAGVVIGGSEDVRMCSSVVDWIARVLAGAYTDDGAAPTKLNGTLPDMVIVDDILDDDGVTGDGHGEQPGVWDGHPPLRELHTTAFTHKSPIYLDECCPSCGEKTLTRNGTCKVCQSCGSTTGCS